MQLGATTKLLIPHITLYVGSSQGAQDAHGLPLLVPSAGGVGVRSRSIRYSAPGSPNKSANTPYNPVGGPKSLRTKEAHGNHLFVPGANGVGQIIMIHGYKHRA